VGRGWRGWRVYVEVEGFDEGVASVTDTAFDRESPMTIDSQPCARCARVPRLPGYDEFLPGTAVPPEVMCEYCVTPLVFDVIADDLQARLRENRLRRRASKGGLDLMKSRRRDPGARGYGSYILVDSQARMIVASGLPDWYGLDLDGVERYLEDNERHHVAVGPVGGLRRGASTSSRSRPSRRGARGGRWPWPGRVSGPTCQR
jgi:hypothetical protein